MLVRWLALLRVPRYTVFPRRLERKSIRDSLLKGLGASSRTVSTAKSIAALAAEARFGHQKEFFSRLLVVRGAWVCDQWSGSER